MQKGDMKQLKSMTGVEYMLLHAQEPILYVISKQHRRSPTQVTPLAHYYIIAGCIYQAPDLQTVINSRIQAALFNLSSAFTETHSYMRYHPTKGYSWEFKDSTDSKKEKEKEKSKEKIKEEQSYSLQRRRMDLLLADLTRKFPPKIQNPPQQTTGNDQIKSEDGNKTTDAKEATQQPQQPSQQQQQQPQQQGTKRPAETSATGPAAKVRASESNRN